MDAVVLFTASASWSLLIGRLFLGVILFAHSAQKVFGLRRWVGADTPCRSTRRAFLIAAAAWPALAWTGGAS